MKSFPPDQRITPGDIVDAFAEQKEHESRYPNDFSRYYDLKCALLIDLFGCDLEAKNVELDEEFDRRSRMRGEERYDIHSGAISFFDSCITVLNQQETPFHNGIQMEGSPTKIERDLWDRFGEQMMAERRQISDTTRTVAEQTLLWLFPAIVSIEHTWRDLYDCGLPQVPPDPLDYW